MTFRFKNVVTRKMCTVETCHPELLGPFIALYAARDDNRDPKAVFGSAIMAAQNLDLCSVEMK